MITVLVVDDHELILVALKGILQNVPGVQIIGHAQNSDEAIELAKQLQWKVKKILKLKHIN